MDNECKNYIHKYKCDTYNENSDACKNCEMQVVDNPIIFTVEMESNKFKIATEDPRGKWANVAGIEKDDLFSVQYYITRRLIDKGKVFFEVI